MDLGSLLALFIHSSWKRHFRQRSLKKDMEEVDPQPDSMDTLRLLEPFLRDLLEQLNEWKHDIKSCNVELHSIHQQLKEGQIYLPQERLACDSKVFQQSHDHEDKDVLQDAVSDDDKNPEAGGTGEGRDTNKNKEDSGWEPFINCDVRDGLGEAIEVRVESYRKLYKNTGSQQGCCEDGAGTGEVCTAFAQANILNRNIPENTQPDAGTATGGFALDKDADIPLIKLNYSGDDDDEEDDDYDDDDDDMNTIVETEQEDDRPSKRSFQDKEEGFPQENAIATYVSDEDVDFENENVNDTDEAKENNAYNEYTPYVWQSCGQWPECNYKLLYLSEKNSMDRGGHSDKGLESDKVPLTVLQSSYLREQCTGFDDRHVNVNKSCVSEESEHCEETQMNRIATTSKDNADPGVLDKRLQEKGDDPKMGKVNFEFEEEMVYSNKTSDYSSYPTQTGKFSRTPPYDGIGFESEKINCCVTQKTASGCRRAHNMDTGSNSENDDNAGPNVDKVRDNNNIQKVSGKAMETKQQHANKDPSSDIVSIQEIVHSTSMLYRSFFPESTEMNNRETATNGINLDINNTNLDFPPDNRADDRERMDEDEIITSTTEQENLSLGTTMDQGNILRTQLEHGVVQQETKSQTCPLNESLCSVQIQIRNPSGPYNESEIKTTNDSINADDCGDQGKVPDESDKFVLDHSIPNAALKREILGSIRMHGKILFPEPTEVSNRETATDDVNPDINNTNLDFPRDNGADERELMDDKTIKDETMTSVAEQENLSLSATMEEGQELRNEVHTTIEYDVQQQETKSQMFLSHDSVYSVNAHIRNHSDLEKDSGLEFRTTNNDITLDDCVEEVNVPESDKLAVNDSIPGVTSHQIIDSMQLSDESLFPELRKKTNEETTNSDINPEISNPNLNFPPDNGADLEQQPMDNETIQDKDMTSITEQKNLSLDTTIEQGREHMDEVNTPLEYDVTQQDTKSQTYPPHEISYSEEAQIRNHGDPEQDSDSEIRTTNDIVIPDDSVDQGNVPVSYAFAPQKVITSDKTRYQEHRHTDENYILDVSHTAEQRQDSSSIQYDNGHCDETDDHNMSASVSPHKDINDETKVNDDGITENKSTDSDTDRAKNENCTSDTITSSALNTGGEHLMLPINKGFGYGQEPLNTSPITATTNVVVDMNTLYNNQAEAKVSNFGPREMKSHICQNGGVDKSCTCELVPNSDVSDRKVMLSNMGDEDKRGQLDDDTDNVHRDHFEKQFDPERKYGQSGSNTSFSEHRVLSDNVNSEDPTSFSNEVDNRLPKTQPLESLISTTDSLPPLQNSSNRITARETRITAIAPSRLFSSPLPFEATAADSESSSMDSPIEDLTSSFTGMETRGRIKTVPKVNSKTSEETRLKKPRLLSSNKHLGPATPDKSIAFKTLVDCRRPIRAGSLFNIVLDTDFNHGQALHYCGLGSFVAPFHGLYLFRLRVNKNNTINTQNLHGHELSIGIEVHDQETDRQFWLCLQAGITSGSRQGIVEKTVVLKSGNLVYVKVEDVRGFNVGLRSVCFEGHSLYKGLSNVKE